MESENKTLEEIRRDNYFLYLRSREPGNIYNRWMDAVSRNDVDEAAEAARAYRNSLLDSCDNMMVPDRPNVDVPAWETYRQALRDIPEQAGFPLTILWPEKPE